MFRSLTEQGDIKDVRNYCEPGCKICSNVSTMLFVIWLFSSVILSKSFTGLLLNSFFNVKYEPIVKTLEDIRENKHILPWGDKYLSLGSKDTNLNFNDIVKRIENNREIFTDLIKAVEMVLKGEAVLLYNSIQRRSFMNVFDSYENRIYVSSTKYLPNYSVFVVQKNREYTNIIQY